MAQNLKKRGSNYYAVLNVPRPLRGQIGRTELVMTLGTADLRQANAVKWNALRMLQERLEALASNSPERLAMLEALDWRTTLLAEQGTVDPDAPRNVPVLTADRAMDALRTRAEELHGNVGAVAASRFFQTATGSAVFLKDYVETFITDQTHTTKQTHNQYRTTIKQMLAHLGESVTAAEITRRVAGDYIALLKQQWNPKTVQSKASAIACFWAWMMERGYIENNPLLNPWKGHKTKQSKRAEEDARRAWKDEELAVILRPSFGADASEPYLRNLPALVRLAVLTGARLEEICEWRAENITKDEFGTWINNEKGKSKAAKRLIPLHPALLPLMERLVAEADAEGFLLHGLTRSGPDHKRSAQMGKQFSIHMRKKIKDETLVFHGLRHTFVSLLEGHDVPLMLAKKIVGHERGDITYGGYSKAERAKLQNYVRKLRYSAAVMKLIAAR